MSRTLRQAIAALSILVLAAAACSNSDDDSSSPTTEGDGGTDTATGSEADRDTFVSLDGVPGVTDDEISYTAIGTRSNNPLRSPSRSMSIGAHAPQPVASCAERQVYDQL